MHRVSAVWETSNCLFSMLFTGPGFLLRTSRTSQSMFTGCMLSAVWAGRRPATNWSCISASSVKGGFGSPRMRTEGRRGGGGRVQHLLHQQRAGEGASENLSVVLRRCGCQDALAWNEQVVTSSFTQHLSSAPQNKPETVLVHRSHHH